MKKHNKTENKAYSEYLIRDYENIREYLRNVYVYGCFTKKQIMNNQKIGTRKHDDEKNRLFHYISDEFIKIRKENRNDIVYCNYNPLDNHGNYLVNTFMNKTYTDLDIKTYFFVQQLLSKGRECTCKELFVELEEENRLNCTEDNFKNLLDSYENSEILVSRKKGRSKYYMLNKDIWEDFSQKELQEIYECLEFVKNVVPFELPYYFLQRRLALYMRVKKMEPKLVEMYWYKHNYRFNVIDSEVMLSCLRAIRSRKYLSIGVNGKAEVVIPEKIIHDATSGRQYLAYYKDGVDKAKAVRLDWIKSVKVKKCHGKAARESEILSDYWCASDRELELQRVVVEFTVKEQDNAFIKRRLDMEKRNGTVELVGEQEGIYVYRYTIDVRDPKEMVPWIKSFGERAKVIESGAACIEDEIADDWAKAVKKYESIR